jgi:uncharacterized protein with ATP-grasp and redox domains
MKYQPECIACSKKQGQRIFQIGLEAQGVSDSNGNQDALDQDLEDLINHADSDLSPADLSFIAIRAGEKHCGNDDPFRALKKQHNELALQLCDDLRAIIRESENPLHTACKLAACGNIIDLGTQENFDIHATIKKVLREGFKVDHFDQFTEFIEDAWKKDKLVNIMYLCDNAGEIVFDKLFIEQLVLTYPNLEITAVVNRGPVLNDATMDDAIETGLDKVVPVIDNGTSDLGTVIKNAGHEFMMVFEHADLFISKGQANYETLSGRDEQIFFILKAKCEVIARSLGVNYLDAVMANKDYVIESQKAAFGV